MWRVLGFFFATRSWVISPLTHFFFLSFFFVMVLLVRYSADTREARRGSRAWCSRAQSIHLWLAVVSSYAVSRWLMLCCVMHGMGGYMVSSLSYVLFELYFPFFNVHLSVSLLRLALLNVDDSGLYETSSVTDALIQIRREYVGYDLDGPCHVRLVGGGPGLVSASKEGGMLRFSKTLLA